MKKRLLCTIAAAAALLLSGCIPIGARVSTQLATLLAATPLG